MTWFALAQRVATAFALDATLIRPAPADAAAAPRPRNAALASTRGRMLAPFADALAVRATQEL